MKSSPRHPNFRQSSLSVADPRHSLLLAMAADLERLRAQAQRIKQLRREKERRDGKEISQETAAYEIGVSARTYRTWEGKGSTIKFDNLQAAANYYGTTTGFIEHGATAATPDLFASDSQLDRIEGQLGALQALMERLAGEEVVAAVQQALGRESTPPGPAGRREAA